LINNTDEFVASLRRRAAGAPPDMGRALRVSEGIDGAWQDAPGVWLLDVGYATGVDMTCTAVGSETR
jgi:hypothetical protein